MRVQCTLYDSTYSLLIITYICVERNADSIKERFNKLLSPSKSPYKLSVDEWYEAKIKDKISMPRAKARSANQDELRVLQREEALKKEWIRNAYLKIQGIITLCCC